MLTLESTGNPRLMNHCYIHGNVCSSCGNEYLRCRQVVNGYNCQPAKWLQDELGTTMAFLVKLLELLKYPVMLEGPCLKLSLLTFAY